jgi:hypothetical protein
MTLSPERVVCMVFDARQTIKVKTIVDRMPSPITTPPMIRMIFSALLPETGAGVAATVCPVAIGVVAAGAPATPAGVPHAVQNWEFGGRAVPHLVQKAAIAFSLNEGETDVPR